MNNSQKKAESAKSLAEDAVEICKRAFELLGEKKDESRQF